MKQIDLQLASPQFALDAEATKQMAAYTAKLQEILQFIVDNTNAVKVLSSAPAVGTIHTIGDGKGNTLSELVVLDHATQSSRKLYYKNSAGTLRLIDSA